MDLSELSNEELRDLLIEKGVQPGPIVQTTRKVYEGKLEKILAGEAPLSTQKTSPPGTRSGDSPNKSRKAKDSDGEENESYEGEESFRKIETHGTYEVPLGNLYPALPNMSLRPAEWFEGNNEDRTSGLSRRSVTSARTAAPATPYRNGGVADSGDKSGGSAGFWIKILVFVVFAIFVFMLLKRMTEGDGVDQLDQDVPEAPEYVEPL